MLREQAGVSCEDLHTSAATPAELYDEVRRVHHLTISPESLRVAINDEFGDWRTALNDGDTVCFAAGCRWLTCFGCAMPHCSPISFVADVQDPACGGYVSFEGWVRNSNDGRSVLRLEYEAFAPLALREVRES